MERYSDSDGNDFAHAITLNLPEHDYLPSVYDEIMSDLPSDPDPVHDRRMHSCSKNNLIK